MNVMATTVLWMSVQIALFSAVGLVAYLLLRRRGPSAAAACCALALGLTLPLAALVLCPWPRWSIGAVKTAANGLGQNGDGRQNAAFATNNHDQETPASDFGPPGELVSTLDIWWQTAVDFIGGGDSRAMETASRVNWQTYLSWFVLAGVGYCLLRTAAGLWAISHLRQSSQPIDELTLRATMMEIIEALDKTESLPHALSHSPVQGARTVGLGTQQRVPELCETAVLRSAATIGWRRPVLLLPSEWRSWSEAERRSVLAHELAHVMRRDYLAGIIARLATSIHFYQPLVLWLDRQLRIQQELAADNCAALVAGGRQTYLTTLAQLALRADEKPLPWAARAFLPGTSMLIKRLAWLKRIGNQKEMNMSRKTRWGIVAAMVAVALAVAGIRGPSSTDTSVALAAADEQKPPAKAPAAGEGETASPTFREAAMRVQSTNNMKQLTLAMWAFHDQKKHLPPAAIRDKDGKALLSWRVAILPFLEENALFDQFRLDEPWDSEHNKPLIAKMPSVFRDPHDDPKSTNSSYFMPTDNGTSQLPKAPWAATIGSVRYKDGVKASAISDGVSNTIMLVEAKRDIPWTKPEDIEIVLDRAKPLPTLGGQWTQGTYGAAFADGSVRVVSDAIDSLFVRPMFTINGGDAVDTKILNKESGAPPQSRPAGPAAAGAAGEPPNAAAPAVTPKR
jgi:hypothetical protein